MNARGSVRVVLASAGTGKTWELATHFLGLLASGVAPDRVLATTFTRKAAGEILARVLARLAGAANADVELTELNSDLGTELTRAGCAALLGVLARSIHRFRVRTLDAYFVEVAQELAPELGLAPDWRIADDIDSEQLGDRALAHALVSRPSHDWLLLLRELERQAGGRAVHATLSRAVRACHDAYLDSGDAAWSSLAPPPPLGADELAELARRLELLPLPRNKDGSPSGPWKKALDASRLAIVEERWEDFCTKGIAVKLLDGVEKFSIHPIDLEVRSLFDRLLEHAAAILGAEIQRQNVAARRLLGHYDGAWRALQRERGLARFGDLPRALAGADEPGSLLARQASRVEHLLLDEFQDTSPAQWSALEPLARDLVARKSSGTSLFCVGDPKQSIYGWRHAEPRLLEDLPAELGVTAEERTQSYRSSQVVLDAVNSVFSTLGSNAVLVAPERAPLLSVAAHFAERFREHRAQRPLAGSVRVHIAPDAEELGLSTQARANLVVAADLVAALHARAPCATIGALARHNDPLPELLLLLRERGVRASGEGGSGLTDSAAVQVALSCLWWLDHPGDSAARFHVETSPLAAALSLARDLDANARARRRLELRTELEDLGLAGFLERLLPEVARSFGGWDLRRFEQLVERAIARTQAAASTPSEFVERVRRERVVDPSAAQVRAMTIHGAKGLEFDAVVLVELDFSLLKKSPALVMRRRAGDPLSDLEAVSRGASKELCRLLARAGDPTLGELHDETRRRELRDELSALYVALTRARRALELVIGPSESSKPAFSFAEILCSALDIAEREPGNTWQAPGSDPRWMDAQEFKGGPARAETQPSAERMLEFAPSRAPRDLERGSPSRERLLASTDLARLLAPADDAARRRGLRWHAWLEELEWLEDFRASDAELRELARARDLGGENLERDLADFRRGLASEAARAVLARAGRGGELEVWRERPYRVIVERDGAHILESGTIDRAVIVREGGRAVRAELIEFKSDRVDEGELAKRADSYRQQLEAYRRALATITGLETSRIHTRVLLVALGRTLELEPPGR